MNREQRRKLEKAFRKKGFSKEGAVGAARTLYNADAIRISGAGTPSPAKELNEGDRVRLDIEKIKARKNWGIMAQAYRDFVESSGDNVYTAHVEHQNLISLAEEPKWLFWSGDLLKEDTPDEGD